MRKKSLYLIDATAFCYRSFYAVSNLTASSGESTGAIYGFINILNKILKNNRIDYIACCFDVSRETLRSKKFAAYKMQRPPMPDGLGSQIPAIKEVIRAYNINIFEKEGFEADDLIAELARKAEDKNLAVTILSSDKDIMQLVNQNISVFNPYKEGGTIYNPEKVKEEFGVSPERIVDLLSLVGDVSDNIPGVRGVGSVTALKLILQFGALENLLKSTSEIKAEKIRAAICESREKLALNQELITLNQKVGMDFDLESLSVREVDNGKLIELFKRFEFKTLLKKMHLPQAAENSRDRAVVSDASEARGLFLQAKEITLYLDSAQRLTFLLDGKIFSSDALTLELRGLLINVKVKKIGHNLKKIKVFFSKEDLSLEGLGFDTMIAAYLLNPARSGYALADLCLDYLDEFVDADNLEASKALTLISRLKPILEKELEEKGLLDLFNDLEMPLAGVLSEMEEAGIKIDLKLLKSLSLDIDKKLVELISGIYAQSGTEFNINSTKQLAEVLFNKLKLPILKKTKTGPSTDEEVLRNLSLKHELPKLLLTYRQLTKLKNTYIDAMPLLVDKDSSRIHTSFNQTGTQTGRLSSSNPNLQNIPIKTEIGKNIRKAVIASQNNFLLLSCDYSQIELRILAHLCKDEALVDAFNKGADIHRATAALIHDVPLEAVTDDMREIAKRVNFGVIYGQGAYSLSKDLGLTHAQGQDFIDAYFLRYPRVRAYINEQVEKARKLGYVTTLLGRRRYIPEINNKNQGIRQFAERQAVNTPIQGSASDLIKLAMVKIAQVIKEKKMKSKMIMQIHDELVFDLPKEELNALASLAADNMENVLQLDVPVKVDLKQGKNWLEMEKI